MASESHVDRSIEDPAGFICLYGKRWLIVYNYGVAAWVAVHKSGTEERAIAPYTEAELITKLDAVGGRAVLNDRAGVPACGWDSPLSAQTPPTEAP
jgi:hypothetical protein